MKLNQAQLIGRVTRDPEHRALPNGTSVVKFGLATNHVYKDASGEKRETAQFHNCVIFGKGADVIKQYVTKGQELYVSGRIEYREWEKKEGGKGYQTEIVINDFQFGQKAKGTAQAEPEEATSESSAPEEINPEEIPF